MMLLSLPSSAASSSGYATVFVYHRFGDLRYPTTSVSMEDFEKQMAYLKENNYNVISLKQLYEIVSSGRPIPPKTVVITVDDGYRTTMKAFKVLRKYHFPFTVFLYMEAIGRYPDFLTYEDIKKLKSSGLVDFENHLFSHPDLAYFRAKLSEKEYLDLLKKEVKLSEDKFLRLFGRKPIFLAFPYGSYDRLSVDFLKKRGYKLLLTQDRGSYKGGLLVPRMAVVGSQSSFEKFVKDLKVEPLPVTSSIPGYGAVKKRQFEVYFKLDNPAGYTGCSIYASGLGWVKAEKKGKFVYSQKPVKAIKPKTRLGIRCFDRETGRIAEYFYLTIVLLLLTDK